MKIFNIHLKKSIQEIKIIKNLKKLFELAKTNENILKIKWHNNSSNICMLYHVYRIQLSNKS